MSQELSSGDGEEYTLFSYLKCIKELGKGGEPKKSGE